MAGAGPHAHLAGNVLTENGDLACLGTDGAGMVKLDKMTGATVWTAEELSDTAAYSSITVADVQGVRTYMTFTESAGVCVRASYRETGRFEIPDKGAPSWAHPVISDGRLYVRNQDTLLVYDIKASS
jgi:outer membrane protein assembly factor BamB